MSSPILRALFELGFYWHPILPSVLVRPRKASADAALADLLPPEVVQLPDPGLKSAALSWSRQHVEAGHGCRCIEVFLGYENVGLRRVRICPMVVLKDDLPAILERAQSLAAAREKRAATRARKEAKS